MSGTGHIGKRTNRPEEIIRAAIRAELASQWGTLHGKITAVNDDGTVNVQPSYKPIGPDGPMTMPELQSVPLQHARGGNGAFIIPPKVGDRVSMSPTMRNADNFHTGEDEWTPDDRRINSLSDMEATLTGGDPASDLPKNYDPVNAHWRADPEGQYGIKQSPDGKFEIKGAQGNVYELIGQAVDLCRDGFDKLSTESTLTHTATYGSIAAQLQQIVGKLEAMKL